MAVELDHFERLIKYFEDSKPLYDLLLGGAKHLGYYPSDTKISARQARLLMQDLIAKRLGLSGSMTVLDAGCGEGIVSTDLSKRYGCKIEAITVVSFETRRATRLAKELGIAQRVRFYLMDYSQMAFRDTCFDAVYTIESLVHSTDIRQTLKEFHRVLESGGRIALFEYSLADGTAFTRYEMDSD